MLHKCFSSYANQVMLQTSALHDAESGILNVISIYCCDSCKQSRITCDNPQRKFALTRKTLSSTHSLTHLRFSECCLVLHVATAQTPLGLHRFVVDLLDNKSHNKLYSILLCQDSVDLLQAFDLRGLVLYSLLCSML